MNVLFIVPPESCSIESYTSSKITRGREIRPKLGLLYVAAYLRRKTGITPVIVDCLSDGIGYDGIRAIIEEHRPDIVGMSTLTFNLLDCLKTARMIKELDKGIKVCLGGFHLSLYPRETCGMGPVDFVVTGEGEETFSELVSKLMEEPGCRDFSGIDGLGWIDAGGNVVLNRAREPIDDLGELPLPAHDLVDLSKYTHVLSSEAKTAYIQTSRGCPFACRFCDIRKTRFRTRSIKSVIEEIRFLHGQGIKEIFFLDDTITVNKKRLIKLCEAIENEGIRIKYKISSRVNTVDEEILDALKRSGCVRIHYGVESGAQRILDYLEKEITVEQIIRAFDLTRRFDIGTYAYMMLGVPTETKEDFDSSLSLVDRIKPDYVTYAICTPLPKTKLYEVVLEQRYFEYDYWQEFAENPTGDFKVRYANENFSDEELRKMQDRAMARFYRSPEFLLKELLRTRSLKQLTSKVRAGYRILFN